MAGTQGRQLAAVMFCDMVGFTAAMQEDEQSALASRDRCRTVIEHAHDEFGGQIVQYYGDGTLSMFSNSANAVRCAVAIQQTLSEEPVVPVRVGLHVGDVVVEEHGLLGDAVNVASRIESFGMPGAVLVSDSVHDLVKNQPDLELVSLGEFHLDNVARLFGIFAIDSDGLVVPDADVLTGKGRRVTDTAGLSNLPVQVTSFVGRVQESAELDKLIRGSRLVTVSGAGGCGKSRLAVEVAAELLDEFADGVWLVELAPLSDGQLAASTVANVLGVQEQPGTETLEVLTSYLGQKNLLLVVDNCEHLIEPVADLVAHLLGHTTGLRIVATSREPLHVRGEAVYHLPTLPVPDDDDDWETLTHTDSVRLFAERAEAAHPGFRVTHDNGAAVASICRHLDGIPLAVELASASTRIFSPEQIDQRLDDRFRLLTGGARDDLDHHRTLEATIDWSYQLLTPEQQTVFVRLSVFAGSFTVDAAEEVCADDRISAASMFEHVVQLADSSLLEVEHSETGGRYDMLETVRAFSGQQLDGDEEEALRVRHATFFADLAEVAFPQFWGPDEVEWMARLSDDYDNLRQALFWMATTGDTQRGLRMAGALYRFWARSRQIGEGMIWLTQLLAEDLTPSGARARALVGAALLGPAEGHSDLLEEAVAIYRQFGPDYELGVAINNLAVQRWQKGRWEESRALYEERLEMAQAAGDQGAISLTSANLIHYFAEVEGDLDTAEQYGIEALEAARQYGSPELVVLSMIDCAYVRSLRGDYKLAESLLQEAIAIESSHPALFSSSSGAFGLAGVYYDMGDYELAHRRMIQAVEEERTWWSDGAATGWGSDTIERLRFMGLIEAARGNSHKATTILSAIESARIQVQLTPGPRSQDLLDTTIAQLRVTLGDEAFQSAWDRGAGMSRDETYDFALNLLDDA